MSYYTKVISVSFSLCLIVLVAEADEQKQSRFLNEVNLKRYPEAQSLSSPPSMRWDFSGNKIYNYRLKQKTVMQMTSSMMRENIPNDETMINAEGSLQIKSQANGTARIVLENLSADMQDSKEGSGNGMKMQDRSPTVIQGFREDSTFEGESTSNQIGLGFVFILPPRPILKGELVEIPVKVPFNAMGSPLQVEGIVGIRLARYVTINNHTCAQFDSNIEISKIEIPPEIEGKYRMSIHGKATSFFDIQERRFVTGSVAMVTNMSAERPGPKVQTSNDGAADLPELTSMSMIADVLFEATPVP